MYSNLFHSESNGENNEMNGQISVDEKIALMGKPRLGEIYRCQVRIKESKEFKVITDLALSMHHR